MSDYKSPIDIDEVLGVVGKSENLTRRPIFSATKDDTVRVTTGGEVCILSADEAYLLGLNIIRASRRIKQRMKQ